MPSKIIIHFYDSYVAILSIQIVITDGDTPGYLFENDIVVYDDDYDYSLPDAVGSVSRLWNKNGTEVIIPYTMPEGVTSMQLREINRAIDEFHKKTCIRYIHKFYS